MNEVDVCIVCGIEIVKINSRQVTCLSESCKREWKSGATRKTAKPTYICLKCGKKTTDGQLCKKCRKANAKIQEWESW